MEGLYFYKLVSPYSEDVTKDCKLTINEIDSNFKNLKDVDIKDAFVDEAKQMITIVRNNGEELKLDLQGVTTNFDVEYNSYDGVIEISHNGKKHLIDGLITKDNLSQDILTKVFSDGTLSGYGTSKSPLRLSVNEKTGYFKPVIRILDTTKGQYLPTRYLAKGDRYITLEETSMYGYLYDFESIKHIHKKIEKTGWRVPSKQDWDNMLNAIEPCEHRNHNSQLNNRELGKLAGKLLKSRENWLTKCPSEFEEDPIKCDCKCCYEEEDTSADIVQAETNCEPKMKPLFSIGVDAYGMGMLPAGYAYDCRPIHFVHFGKQGAYWSTTQMVDSDVYTKVFDNDMTGVLQIGENPSSMLSIRLVRDYDGTNFNEVENIDGKNYKAVLMPALNTPQGYAIWLGQNLEMTGTNIKHLAPIDATSQYVHTYYINEWNGYEWERKEMLEGESVTVRKGERTNDTYKLTNGVLVNETDALVGQITKEVITEIDIESVKSRLDEVEKVSNDHEERIVELEAKTATLASELAAETTAREAQDAQLQNNIDREAELREQVDLQIWQQLNEEFNGRTQNVKDLWAAIENEGTIREAEDKKLYDVIINEASQRNEVDGQIWTAINKLDEDNKAVDAAQWDAINTEAETRQRIDNEQWDAIQSESERAKEAEDTIQGLLSAEVDRALKAETVLAEAIADEVKRAEEAEKEITESLGDTNATIEEIKKGIIDTENTSYDAENGTITIATLGNEPIVIDLDYNFGKIKRLSK